MVLISYSKQQKVKLINNQIFSPINVKAFQDVINSIPKQIVITNTMDENWGFLSTQIGTRTTKWINMTNHLRLHHSDYETFQHFIDSEKILLMVGNTHVDPMIGFQQKFICVPLGIRSRTRIWVQARTLLTLPVRKTRLLMINNSGWGDRKMINEMVSKAFNNTVRNTYKVHNKKRLRVAAMNGQDNNENKYHDLGITDHIWEVATSKFVLCPSGLGMDTYRLWETLLLGSIPIVESNAGFDRTYSNLPVLVISHYSKLTPKLLHKAYDCFQRNLASYHYEYLRESYWLKMIRNVLDTGTRETLDRNHPRYNPHCNFLGEY